MATWTQKGTRKGGGCLVGAEGGEDVAEVALGAAGQAVAGGFRGGLQVGAGVHRLQDAKVVLKVPDELPPLVWVVRRLLHATDSAGRSE